MAYRHILVPFDESPLAQAALSVGAWIAWRTNGELDLVRAVPHVHAVFATRPVPGMTRLEAEEDSKDIAAAKTELSVKASQFRENGVTSTGEAFLGAPGPVLLEYIQRRRIDLVVMGTHGRSAAERWLLGSVAHDVVCASPAPVLLVPRESHFHRDDQLRVLVAYDGSEPARAALDASLTLADAVPASLTLFLVLPGESRDSESAGIEWYEEPVLGAPPDLEYAAAELAKRGMSCRRAYSFGDAAEEILKFTQRGDFDLVAIGTHSRSGFDRLVMGSVAEQVTRQAHVPVLIATGLTQTATGDGSRDAGRAVPA